MTTRPIIWSIAGSDCSGGAGIQADLKTGHALGCEVCTLITANTVQNSEKLVALHPVGINVLQQQVDVLIEDKPPKAIKIGMLANNAQIAWLIYTLKTLKNQLSDLKVVLDPVMKASVGKNLSEEALDMALYQQLIALTDLITPNDDEALRLRKHIPSESNAQALLNLGTQAVIITGGHSNHPSKVIDTCYFEKQCLTLESPRVDTSYGHGSGCSFATAMASFMALDYLLRDAFMQTKAFMNAAFKASEGQKDGYGAIQQPTWPVAKHFYPKAQSQAISDNTLAFPSLGTANLGLYPVIDSLYWLERLLPLGLEIIQIRLKNKTPEEVEAQLTQAVEMAKAYPKTRLFINDYWQLAIELGAYGVHLGQEDLAEADLNAIQQAGLRLGISTHGSFELKLSEQVHPSYLAIGAIFPTQTKDMTGQIQGLQNLEQLVKLKSDYPIVAIGGITLERAPKVLATGVNSIAVVTAITLADNPEQAVADFQALFN